MNKINKLISIISKTITDFFLKFFFRSKHYFILDLGKGSNQKLYSLHNYKNPLDYLRNQMVKTEKKISQGYDRSWCTEDTISKISDYLVSKGGKKNYKGICHGTRIGKEVEWFNRCLPSGSHVFGTDIEPSAKNIKVFF